MAIEYITYFLEISELHLIYPIEINYDDENITLVRIENSIETYPYTKVNFIVSKIDDLQTALSITQSKLYHILNRIAYITDSRITKPDLIYYKLSERDEPERLNEIRTLTMTIRAGIAEAVKEELEKEEPYLVEYIEQYRSALESEDIVSRYMFLYNILLQIFYDNQKDIDSFIRGEIEGTRAGFTNSPIGDFYESKFTRLRNEIGHKRANTNFGNTRVEMEASIDDLMHIVKKAISKKGR